MKQVNGFWLPDNEDHLATFVETGPEWHGGPTYQAHKLKKALKFVKERRHVVDVGAHCGLWSRVLAHEFKMVTAFEPLQKHRDCFVKNVPTDKALVILHAAALGEKPGTVRMKMRDHNSTGSTRIQDDGDVVAELAVLDSFGLKDVDFIKLDCEGYEYFSIKGGEETIRRDRPCIIVEQKPGNAEPFGLRRTQAVELLQEWGATLRFEISGDFCLTW